MKNKAKKAGILSLILFLTGCKPLFDLFPKKVPEFEDAPLVAPIVNPQSGPAPLTTNISFDAKDPNGDRITGYRIEIDYNRDGKTDKFIPKVGFSSFPFSVDEIFENQGTPIIYAVAVDEHGKRGKGRLEIKVLKPIPGNIFPVSELTVDPTQGAYPFTTNISLNGTDPDGTIVEYEIKIDVLDGVTDEKDETITSSEPITISRTFDDSGNVKVYGTVTDDRGGKTTESRTIQVLEKNDLNGEITLKEMYNVGDFFSFIGKIQNATNNNVLVDNSQGDCLEYRLMKEEENERRTMFQNKVVGELKATLLSEGYVKLDYKKDTLTTTVYRVKIEGAPFPILWEQQFAPVPNPTPYQFTEAGKYFIEILVKYSFGENNPKSKQKLSSNYFLVN